MPDHSHILDEIEQFKRDRPMSATTFGLRAVNDGKLVPRLKAGANVTVATLDRVRDFIRKSVETPA